MGLFDDALETRMVFASAYRSFHAWSTFNYAYAATDCVSCHSLRSEPLLEALLLPKPPLDIAVRHTLD